MWRFNDYPLHHFLEVLRARYREANKDVEFLPFFYNSDFLPIAAASTATVTNTTDQDSDFIVINSMQAAHEDSDPTAHIQFPNMTCRITAQVAGRQMQDRATALINVFGRGQRPYPWPRPWIIPAKSSWTTLVTNLHPETAIDLRLTYAGVKAIPIPLA